MRELTITEAEYKELKSYRTMLGQIGAYVEDFCNEQDTTLVGVLRLLALYHAAKSNELHAKIDELSSEHEETT